MDMYYTCVCRCTCICSIAVSVCLCSLWFIPFSTVCTLVALPDSLVSSVWPAVADRLALGMSDNWSQVGEPSINMATPNDKG